jgi:hypothetical protein
MSCERFKARLTDLALGADDAELHAHLDSCAACRAALEAQRALVASIDRGVAALVDVEPSTDLAARVRRRIAPGEVAPRPRFAFWRPLTAAAVLTLVLVVALLIGRSSRPPASARRTEPTPAARATTPPVPAPQAEVARAQTPPPAAVGRHPRGEQRLVTATEPEVLVPRGEMAAVMRLFNDNHGGKADGTSLLATTASVADSLQPMTTAALAIVPLEIEPLEEEGKSRTSPKSR